MSEPIHMSHTLLKYARHALVEGEKPIGAREAAVATRAAVVRILPQLANNLLRYTVFDITDSVDRLLKHEAKQQKTHGRTASSTFLTRPTVPRLLGTLRRLKDGADVGQRAALATGLAPLPPVLEA